MCRAVAVSLAEEGEVFFLHFKQHGKSLAEDGEGREKMNGMERGDSDRE